MYSLVSLVLLCDLYNPRASFLLVAALALALCGCILPGRCKLDGAPDTADPRVGGLGNHERTLDIMKDPRVGAMAVAAMIVVFW